MHIALHVTFGSELVRLRAAELRERRSTQVDRRHPRRPLPSRGD